MKATKYTVYAVERDGNPYDVATLPGPEALALLRAKRAASNHRTIHFGVFDPNNEEQGDQEIALEEAEYEAAIHRGPSCDGCGAAFGAGCECLGNKRAIGRGERREPWEP